MGRAAHSSLSYDNNAKTTENADSDKPIATHIPAGIQARLAKINDSPDELSFSMTLSEKQEQDSATVPK